MKMKKLASAVPTLRSFLLVSALFVFAGVVLPPVASAQQEADDPDAPIEEIIVSGIRGSLDSAAAIKRTSDQMVDAITAEDIGLFSDNNIAEAVQRIPGVQLERDAGEGFRISIRGLGPRFIRTTVNGRTALSAAGGEDGSSEDSRGFTLNMIPSEVITRVTVEKSIQAHNLEGGMGGTLDLQTNRPIDFANRKKEDFYISTALRGGHNDLVNKEAYRGSLFLNKKFTDNFGLFFGMVLDDTDRADHAIESEALRVRDDFRIDRLDDGTLLNGAPQTEDQLDDLYDSWRGENGERAYPTFMNGARNSMRDFDRARETFTTGLQWQTGNFDVNFDYTFGHEKNNQYLRRFAMSPGQVARRDEGFVTSIDIDWSDEDFARTTPTPGFVESFQFVDARGDERVNTENRQINREQEIHVGGINVDWSNDVWTINGDVGYALMEMDRYDNQLGTQWNSEDDGRRDPRFVRINGGFELVDGYPVATLEGYCDDVDGRVDCTALGLDGVVTPFDPTDPGQFFFRRAWRTLTSEEADDISARLDFSRVLAPVNDGTLRSILDEIQFGVAWNERTGIRTKGRAREDDAGSRGDNFAPISVDDVIAPYQTILITDYLPDITGAVHEMVFLSHDDPIWDTMWAVPKSELHNRYLQHDQGFDVTEEISAAYFQLPFSNDNVRWPFRGNIGLRYVRTDQTGYAYEENSYISEDRTEIIEDHFPRYTERDYDDWLPSFNVAIDVSEDWVMRFAASKSLSRPDPLDLTSYVSLGDFDSTEDDVGSGSGGNPDLRPYRSTNVDFSLEWYPEFGGSYALGLFHKHLNGWIARGRSEESFFVPVAVDGNDDGEFDEDDITDGIPGNGGDYYEMREEIYSIRRKVNTDGGTIKGAEFAFHLPFDSFTDSAWSYFGINGSVTYVDAEIDAVVPENNLPVSLRGTSEWSGNLVVYFELDKFSARAAYNYRDDFLFQEAEDPERHAEWTKGSEIFDLNLSYRPTKRTMIRLSANNLTGVTRERYWQTAGLNRFSDDRDNGQYYTLEFRWRSD